MIPHRPGGGRTLPGYGDGRGGTAARIRRPGAAGYLTPAGSSMGSESVSSGAKVRTSRLATESPPGSS
jgi:hypothetical protein